MYICELLESKICCMLMRSSNIEIARYHKNCIASAIYCKITYNICLAVIA